MVVADIDGLAMVRVTIPEDQENPPMLTLVYPATTEEPASSLTLIGLEAIVNLRNAIDEEIARLGERIALRDDDIPM